MGRYRREQLAKAVETSGDDSLETLATFRRHPLFSYGMTVVMAMIGIANLATDQLWARIAFVVAALVTIIGPSGFVTVGAGPTRAFVFERGTWRSDIGSSSEPLPRSQVERISALRWRIAGHSVWAWGDNRRTLERLAGV